MKGRTFHVLSVEHAELDKERQTDRQSDRHTETFLYGETLLRLKIMNVVFIAVVLEFCCYHLNYCIISYTRHYIV